MEKTILMKLELRAPLFYSEIISSLEDFTQRRRGTEIAECIRESGEILLCFELNPKESRSIEPDRGQFLENLVFLGRKSLEGAQDTAAHGEKEVILPAGNYLFVQNRGEKPLNREEWLDMAIEQQKDGLWERHKPRNLFYVRYLFEDRAFVTQLFRPV